TFRRQSDDRLGIDEDETDQQNRHRDCGDEALVDPLSSFPILGQGEKRGKKEGQISNPYEKGAPSVRPCADLPPKYRIVPHFSLFARCGVKTAQFFHRLCPSSDWSWNRCLLHAILVRCLALRRPGLGLST